jgi:hypothetical protein
MCLGARELEDMASVTSCRTHPVHVGRDNQTATSWRRAGSIPTLSHVCDPPQPSRTLPGTSSPCGRERKVVLAPPCPQSGIPRITRYPKIVSGCCQDRPEWEHKKTGSFSTGMLRRLLHHGTVVNIRGQSYRLKEKLKGGLLESGEPTDQRISRRQKQPSD